MISDESFRLCSYCFRTGFWTQILPFKWNSKRSVEIVSDSHLKWRRGIGVLQLAMQWTLLWSAHQGPLQYTHIVDDVFFFALLISPGMLSSVIQLHVLLYTSEFAAVISSMCLFDQ